jgi:hypothetical protein
MTQQKKDLDGSVPEPKPAPASSNPASTSATPKAGHYSSDPDEAWGEAIEEGVRAGRLIWKRKHPEQKSVS